MPPGCHHGEFNYSVKRFFWGTKKRKSTDKNIKASMSVLRQKEYRLEALWNIYTHPAQQVASSVTFLTVHSGIMQDNPLPQHRFFGRKRKCSILKSLPSPIKIKNVHAGNITHIIYAKKLVEKEKRRDFQHRF